LPSHHSAEVVPPAARQLRVRLIRMMENRMKHHRKAATPAIPKTRYRPHKKAEVALCIHFFQQRLYVTGKTRSKSRGNPLRRVKQPAMVLSGKVEMSTGSCKVQVHDLTTEV
jgi:hypothetical protein